MMTERVMAMRDCAKLEMIFPRVAGYRVDLPAERLFVKFTDDSAYVLTPEEVGPSLVLKEARNFRPSEISCRLFA